MNVRTISILPAAMLVTSLPLAAEIPTEKEFTSSIGMNLVRIEAVDSAVDNYGGYGRITSSTSSAGTQAARSSSTTR